MGSPLGRSLGVSKLLQAIYSSRYVLNLEPWTQPCTVDRVLKTFKPQPLNSEKKVIGVTHPQLGSNELRI